MSCIYNVVVIEPVYNECRTGFLDPGVVPPVCTQEIII